MTKELTDRIALEPLIGSGWSMVEGRDALTKEFKFESFRQAWAWMSEMALWAEKLDHHPEWCTWLRRNGGTIVRIAPAPGSTLGDDRFILNRGFTVKVGGGENLLTFPRLY